MPYSPYHPATYQPMPYPAMTPPMAPQAPQMMTPPTIRAEIVQVDGETGAAQYPVGAGASQMMIAKDDSFIAVKTALANGQYALDFYDKRPPAPVPPPFDPSAYVRRDEIDSLVAAAVAAHTVTGKKQEAAE